MLTALSIRDFVLIDRLNLEPRFGLTTLTGETGAGKSIILDALGLCLGGTAEKRFIRAGTDAASVIAEFAPAEDHAVWAALESRDVACDPAEPLIIRRIVRASGPARAFINDQPVSAALLAEIGDTLIEVHGQGAATGLLRPSSHRSLLDRFAGNEALLEACGRAWTRYAEAKAAHEALRAGIAATREDQDWLTEAVEELDTLGLEPGEAARLADSRALLLQAGQIAESVAEAERAVSASCVEDGLGKAARAIERVLRVPELASSGDLPALAGAASDGIERALIEIEEAGHALARLASRIECDEVGLDSVEERLQALRAIGRKHGVEPDHLPDVHAALKARLQAVTMETGALEAARQAEVDAAARWRAAADRLGRARRAAAKGLRKAVEVELKPLQLGRVSFRVAIEALAEGGANGADHVEFEAETNPGAGFGPLRRIASGGELARFSLALKCALAESGGAGVLVFDEVDHGVGGAVAAAIGGRLRQLAADRQVFAITHSPQVAASGAAQWRVAKSGRKGRLGETRVSGLEPEERTEEIARMLSGATVTQEARAAAAKLLEAPCQISSPSTT